MAEGLKKILTEDVTKALKSGDKVKVSVLRLVLSEIKNKELQKRNALQENELYNIVRSMSKRYRDAIPQFKAGGREDLVKKEEGELKIIESYLPEEIGAEELTRIVEEVIKECGALSIKDMGRVMKGVIEKVSGRADSKLISDIVRRKLTDGR